MGLSIARVDYMYFSWRVVALEIIYHKDKTIHMAMNIGTDTNTGAVSIERNNV